MTVRITRRNHDAGSLREHAARVGEAGAARRLLALALVLEGHSRAACSGTGIGIHPLPQCHRGRSAEG